MPENRERQNGRDTAWALGGSSCPEAGAAVAMRDEEVGQVTMYPTGGCGATVLTQQGSRTQPWRLQSGGAGVPSQGCWVVYIDI